MCALRGSLCAFHMATVLLCAGTRGWQCTYRPCSGCMVIRHTSDASICSWLPICAAIHAHSPALSWASPSRPLLANISVCHLLCMPVIHCLILPYERSDLHGEHLTCPECIIGGCLTCSARRKWNLPRRVARVVGRMSCARGMPIQARAPAPKGSVLLTCRANCHI